MDIQNEILTPLQSRVMSFLFSDEWFRRHFYLTGGTALSAFYLHHRLSEDLDFFSHGIDISPTLRILDELGKQMKVEAVQSSPGFKRYLVGNELKIDIVAETDFRIGAPELIDGFMIDCLKNIAVNKVCTILGRLDAKDYIDLYFIFKDNPGMDIFELLSLGSSKDGGLEPFVWASLIADVKTLTIFPRMIRELSHEELKIFFFGLRDRILDKIKPANQ